MKIMLCGCTGAMGRTVQAVCAETPDADIVCGFAAETGNCDFPVYQSLDTVTEEPEVIMDFSFHAAIGEILDFAEARNLPVVIATTGHTEEEEGRIRRAAERIPILKSGNMSLGVHAIVQATKLLAQILNDYDVELVEKHHHFKKDAPSGTAKMLISAVQEVRPELVETYGREGQTGERKPTEIGVHALRAGTIVGEHSVYFAAFDEVVEIKHTALSKAIFAKGAVKACRYLTGRDAGYYTMEDLNEGGNL